MPIVAFDSTPLKIGKTVEIDGVKKFEGSKALVGASITVSDPEKFKSQYDAEMDKLFNEHDIEKRRKVNKSAHIYAQLYSEAPIFMDNFIRRISSNIARVNIFYTYFYPQKFNQQIAVFRDSYQDAVNPPAFLDLIQNSYPYICAWRYLEQYPENKDFDFLIDHIEGSAAPAWDKIKTLPNLKIYFSGGECNCFISTADILSRVVCDRIKAKRMPYFIGSTIKEVLSHTLDGVDIKMDFLGWKTEYLHYMAPSIKVPIGATPKLKHPIIFLLKGTIKKEDLEWTPLLCNVMNYAYENDCAVKFFAPSDNPIIKESQDILAPINGQSELNFIKRSGFNNIKVLSNDEFLRWGKK